MQTAYKFAHRGRHPETGEQVLKWASGVGDLEADGLYVPVGTRLEHTLLRAQEFEPNFLADEGEEWILDTFFRGATAPTSFYFRLFNDTPVETDAISDLTGEVTGTGYAAIAVARNTTDFPTLALNSGDFRVTSVSKVFTAGGTWSAATFLALTTSTDSSGKLIAARALSATRTLENGDTLTVTYSLTLS